MSACNYNPTPEPPEDDFCTCEEFALCDVCLAERHRAAARFEAGLTARPVFLDETGQPFMFADHLGTETAPEVLDELLIDARIADLLMAKPTLVRAPRKPADFERLGFDLATRRSA